MVSFNDLRLRKQQLAVWKFVNELIDKRTTYTYYVPQNIPWESLYQRLNEFTNEEVRSCVSYFLQLIVKDNSVYGRNGYTDIYCEPVSLEESLLRNILKEKWIPVREALKAERIVWWKPYVIGRNTRRYVLWDSFLHKKLEEVIISDKAVVSALKRRDKKFATELKHVYELYTPVLYSLMMKQLIIDGNAARTFLKKMYFNLCRRLAAKKLEKQTDIDIINKEIETRYTSGLMSISKLESKNYSFKIENVGRRIYSPLSEMMSILRNFLTHEGQPLISFDIKNSQPFHFCYMLDVKFWTDIESDICFKKLDPELYNTFLQDGIIDAITMHLESTKTDKKLKEFKKSAIDGKIYQKLSEKFSSISSAYVNENSAKYSVMKFLNFKTTDRKKKNRAYDLFKQEYPAVAGLMELIKINRHQHMSTILQRFEAKMILDKCGNGLQKKYPSHALYSIHDSLLTTNNEREEVSKTIQSVYKKHFGFYPKIKIEDLKEENAYQEMDKYLDKRVNHIRLNKSGEKPIKWHPVLEHSFWKFYSDLVG